MGNYFVLECWGPEDEEEDSAELGDISVSIRRPVP